MTPTRSDLAVNMISLRLTGLIMASLGWKASYDQEIWLQLEDAIECPFGWRYLI